MTKLVIVVRYDLAEPSFDAVTTRLDALRTRLADLGPADVWMAHGEPCDRVSAAVDDEQTPCACGLPWTTVPPGHALIRGTDLTDHCGQISVTEPPEWLAWTTLGSN